MIDSLAEGKTKKKYQKKKKKSENFSWSEKLI